MRRALPPLAWFAVIMLGSTDLFSAGVTGHLLGRVLAVVVPSLPADLVATLNGILRTGAHLVAYGVLAVLIRPAAAGSGRWAVALAVAAAGIDEAHQATTAARTGSPADVALDAVGAVLGLALATLVRRWRTRAMSRPALVRAAVAALVVFLSGCATSPPYRVNLQYRPGNVPAGAPGAAALIVGLAPAGDARNLTDPAAIGRRLTSENEVEPIMPAGERPEGVVTEALRAGLVESGYTVRPVPAWDLKVESLDPAWGDAVVGAEILDFWTEARSEALKPTRISSRARIRLVLADPKARRIVWTNTVESASEQDVLRFTPHAAETNANEALGGALRLLVESRDLRDRLAALR